VPTKSVRRAGSKTAVSGIHYAGLILAPRSNRSLLDSFYCGPGGTEAVALRGNMTFQRRSCAYLALATIAALTGERSALADEGGTGFWAPGSYGSLAATLGAPGWSFGSVYYHASVSIGANKDLERGGLVVAGLDQTNDTDFFGPNYTFAAPVLDGQLQLSLVAVGGHASASVIATITGPGGNAISGRRADDIWGFGDLNPQATLKWSDGFNNFMTYLSGNIPVGNYDPARLSNLGLGHAAIDGGGGYTYLNQDTGFQASAVLGLTGNFENGHTGYTSGLDAHLDWAVSQFISPQFHGGIVGYFYRQLTGDSGPDAKLGSFESRVIGLGPEVGYTIPLNARLEADVNLRGYGEFASKDRPSGWNLWLTIGLSRAVPG